MAELLLGPRQSVHGGDIDSCSVNWGKLSLSSFECDFQLQCSSVAIDGNASCRLFASSGNFEGYRSVVVCWVSALRLGQPALQSSSDVEFIKEKI